MSMIAGVLVLAAAPGAAVTPEQAMAAHRAATSIGPDRCRRPTGDEIVVCARRESPYALPLYEPVVRDAGLSGREREDAVLTLQDTAASCHARGEACLKPLPVVRVGFGAGTKPGIVVGKD